MPIAICVKGHRLVYLTLHRRWGCYIALSELSFPINKRTVYHRLSQSLVPGCRRIQLEVAPTYRYRLARIKSETAPGIGKRNLNIKNARAACLVSFLLVLAVACGAAEGVMNVAADDSAAAGSATPTSPAKASSTEARVVSTPTTAGVSAASAIPTLEAEARPPAFRVLAETTFVHDGFRTEVSGTLEGKEIGRKASSASEGKQIVTVSLRNLSPSTGGIQIRATINFAPGLNNLVALPTSEGPLTLYLHRTGALDLAPDTGGIT